MTDETRTVSRLLKANRPAAPSEPAAPTPAAAEPALATPRASAPRKTPTKTTGKDTSAAAPKHSITVSVPQSTRNRSRATFRATQHLEGDESYSDFVGRAIDAEIARRERLYNDGDPFAGGDRNLPSGRPLGS